MDTPDIERLTRELDLRKRLQEAFLVFSRGIAAKLALSTALESFTSDVNELFGTARTSVWLYDRNARLLNLAASSDPREVAPSTIGADDESPIARALGSSAPESSGSGPGSCLAAPMRGWRRALGVLVIEGAPSRLSPEQLVELTGELARQLSVTVENLIVLDEAIHRYEHHEEVLAQLAQAKKLASLGQLVAGVAHEMKNPLQGVLGHLELLMQKIGGGDPHRATLERVYNDADRAARMVENLLAFAGSPRAAKRRVNVSQLIAETIAMRRATPHRPDVDIISRGTDDVPPVIGDPALLQQALLNIVINAEQAIAAEIAPRIFDPFVTTKAIGKGTGLGLAITFGIVQEHGGTISAATSPRGGAVFTIQLPAALS